MSLREATGVRARLESVSTAQHKTMVQIGAVLIAILGWEIAGQFLGENLFAPFSAVVAAYIDLAQRGEMFGLLVKSLSEMLLGFGLAVAFAVPVGLVMGRNRVAEQLFTPWVSAFFATSTSALLPLLIVMVGINLPFRLTVIWLACVWHILLNLYHGAQGIDQELVDVGRSFNAPSMKVFKDIVLPGVLPFLISGLRMGITRAIRGFILAETYIRIGYGGYLMDFGQQSISTAPVLALILNVMLLGYGLRKLLEMAEGHFAPWAEDIDTSI